MSKIIPYSAFIFEQVFKIVGHSKQSQSYYLHLTVKSQCWACCLGFSYKLPCFLNTLTLIFALSSFIIHCPWSYLFFPFDVLLEFAKFSRVEL